MFMKHSKPLQTTSKRVGRSEKQQLQCIQCHDNFSWLSVESLCWECLKRAMKGKKDYWIHVSQEIQNTENTVFNVWQPSPRTH